jgi:hypothetical protein
MSRMMEHPVVITKPQIKKLMSGGAIMMKPQQFVDSGSHSLVMMPQSARKIATAMRKNKGIRIMLKPDEDLLQMTEGGKISLKSIGRSFSKAFDPKKNNVANTFNKVGSELEKGAKIVKKGFNKEIVDSGVGREIAKNLIDIGTDVVLPGALGGLSMLAGDPTGMSGQMVGSVAGKYINRAAEKGGYGARGGLKRIAGGSTYAQRLARRTKNTFKDIGKVAKKVASNPVVKEIGKQALREGAKAAGEALTAYSGNPALGIALERTAVAGGDKLIDSGSLKKAGRATAGQAKRIATEVVDDYIDANLTGVERDIAQKALAGKYPSARDLVYDYGNSKIEDMISVDELGNTSFGYGIMPIRRARGRPKMSGAGTINGAVLSAPYKSAMKDIHIRGAGVSSGYDFRQTTSAPDTMTLSPYARMSSPQMSPFIPDRSIQANHPGLKQGGSFLPAGQYGRGFNPAG